VFTYHFGYQQIAGINHRVGRERAVGGEALLGPFPVQPDGSALFRAPAKTPNLVPSR